MRIGIYGGSFDPPHLGHLRGAENALRALALDRLLVMPANLPPHKRLAAGSPAPEERLKLTEDTFSGLAGAEVSDLELRRGGASYTVETLEELRDKYPGAELVLLMGTDMLLYLEKWYRFADILRYAEIGAFARADGQNGALEEMAAHLRKAYGANITVIPGLPVEVSSTALRQLLPRREGRELLTPAAYARIIRNRWYGARPELSWLREDAEPLQDPQRLPHVRGCAETAVKLAVRWGEDPAMAEEAGLLHDLTKKYDLAAQLKLCEKYGIIPDSLERCDTRLLHSMTSAAMARERYGCDETVVSAIRWHTTGRAGMTTLEKIICLADFLEPTRTFADLTALRQESMENLDGALYHSFQMTMESLARRGIRAHPNTREAMEDCKPGSVRTEQRGNA